MKLRCMAVLAVAGFAGALGGCGIIGVGIALPAAVASNENFVAKGVVVDPTGKPLTDVYVTQSWTRVWFDPVWGTNTETENKTLTVGADGSFEFPQRGSSLLFTFKKEGYESQDIRMEKHGDLTASANIAYGDRWAKGTPLCIVLVPKDFKRPTLPVTTGIITKPDTTIEGPIKDIAMKMEFTIGTATKRADGSVDAMEIALPNQLVLRGAKEGMGFVRFVPKGGSTAMMQMGEAPAEGYSPELAIDTSRMKEIRKAGKEDVIKGHEFFYFVVDGKYGKGEIHWSPGGDGLDTRVAYTLLMNPDGTRNVMSQEPPR